MDAVGLASGNLEIAWPSGASRKDDGVVLRAKLFNVAIDADVSVRHKRLKIDISTRCEAKTDNERGTYHTLGGHEIDATLDDLLV